jgi:cytohesin
LEDIGAATLIHDVNDQDENGETLLHLAVRLNNVRAIRTLIGLGVDMNARNTDGGTPLYVAARNNCLESVQLLLLPCMAVDVNARDNNDRTPLHVAAERGHLQVVVMLLSLSTKVEIDAGDKTKQTPLHVAAKEGHSKVVGALISLGASVNARNENGETPLHVAAKEGHSEVVEVLLAGEGIDVNAWDEDEQTPLYLAAENGHSEVVRILLTREEIDVNARNWHGNAPLHVAAGNDVPPRMITKMELYGLRKVVPLYVPAGSGNLEIVKMLLEKEGIDVNAKNSLDDTPLHWAAGGGNSEVVGTLLAYGANVNARGKSNCGSIIILLGLGGTNRSENRRLLLARNAALDESSGDTPIHWAVEKGHPAIVRMLLDQGVDVNIKGWKDQTPLHCAAKAGRSRGYSIVPAVIIHWPSAPNSEEAALDCAARQSSLEIIGMLLEKEGVDVNAQNYYGETPLRCAESRKNLEIAGELRTRGAHAKMGMRPMLQWRNTRTRPKR